MLGWGVVNNHNERNIILEKYITHILPVSACENEHVNITAKHHICTYSSKSQSYKGDSGAPALYTIQKPRRRNCGKYQATEKQAENRGHPEDFQKFTKAVRDTTTNCIHRSINLDAKYDELLEKLTNDTQRTDKDTDGCYVSTNVCPNKTDGYFTLHAKDNPSDKSQRHVSCGDIEFNVTTKRFLHYSCNGRDICFTSNQTCTRAKYLCCTAAINLSIRCDRNKTLHEKFHNQISQRILHEDFDSENYVCTVGPTYDGSINQESYGKKVVVGITSFHLDTHVVLTNITTEYLQFILDAIRNMDEEESYVDTG